MFKFQPLLKSTLWGGEKIIPFKHLTSQQHQVGESWELSGVEGYETIVSEGPCQGKKLNELGPDMTWSSLPLWIKWVCTALMLFGRLEIFNVLILFTSPFWKDN